MSIADNVRATRKARKMTQVELAERAGVAQGLISQIEGGQDNIKAETLLSLAAALNCAAIDLLPDEYKRRQLRA